MSLSYLHGGTSQLNKRGALSDWNCACRLAETHGRSELIDNIPESFGVKRIDAKTCKLLIQLGVSKENAEAMEYECCYQWEKAAKQLKAQQNKRLQQTPKNGE